MRISLLLLGSLIACNNDKSADDSGAPADDSAAHDDSGEVTGDDTGGGRALDGTLVGAERL